MLVKALVIASACSRTPQARCPSLPLTGVTCRDLRISLAPAYSLTHQPSECVATKARARTCRNAKISCSSALSRSVNPPPAASPPFFTSSMEPDLPSSFTPPKLTVRSLGQQGRTLTHLWLADGSGSTGRKHLLRALAFVVGALGEARVLLVGVHVHRHVLDALAHQSLQVFAAVCHEPARA